MDKCHIIIVDTINSKKFSSKNVKNIFNEIIISNLNFFTNDRNYLSKHVEFIDLDMKCDKVAIEKALLRNHLFINIINSSTISSLDRKDSEDGYFKKIQNHIQNSLSFRYYNLLKHAFISRNRNALFLLVDDDDDDDSGGGEGEETEIAAENDWDHHDKYFGRGCEMSRIGLTSLIMHDQRIRISTGHSFERKMQIWLLTKLISLDGNFPFFCFPILSKLISLYNGIVQMKLSSIDSCGSLLSEKYSCTAKEKLAVIPTECHSHTVPIFIYASKLVDWAIIKKCIYEKFNSSSTFIGHFKSRIHPICQDINFLLVSLLKYFRIYPKDVQLPFTTPQMATLVSDCLRSKSSVHDGKFLIIYIEDIDWIASSSLTNDSCSWLPEKCAPNIQIIITAARDSIHEKSLKCRLNPPIFIDFPSQIYAISLDTNCVCRQSWCLTKLLYLKETFDILITSLNDDVKLYFRKILSIFMCCLVCGLTRSQIDWLLSFDISILKSNNIFIGEKGESELSEKMMMNSSKEGRLPLSDKDSKNISTAIHALIDNDIIQQINLNSFDEPCYSLTVPQLTHFISYYLKDCIEPKDIELIKCRLGAYYVYQATDLHMETLFVPGLLQYLSELKNTTLKDWLLNWPVFMKLKDEFCVPVKLLSLWRSVLGPNTDYKPMINAYISTYLPDKRDLGDCCSCKRSINIELQQGPVELSVLRQSPSDFSKAYSKHRDRVLLDLARTSMQVGQYAVAKEMARSLLKQLDYLTIDRSYFPPLDSNRNLLASCLHLLFCTLDERLKTFEFVTEQTTPIFRRTVHYGARALLLQNEIVTQIQRAIDNTDNQGLGDVRTIDSAKLQQQLCQAEIRLAHIMTHFVFSLDGVDQTVINRHFMQSDIRSVTYSCMCHAHDIAIRLKDRQLLLEIQMTFGVIQPRENFKEKILLYKTPLRQALCIYGESHIFVSRLYINIGISYEEQKKYIKAFEYFTLWSHVTHELLGRNHCKSLRSCGVFKEPIFKLTAEFLKNLNEEEPNESLEEELSDCINNIDSDNMDIQGTGISVSGIGIGGSTNNHSTENISYENIFMMRTTMEHESDWEIHSSDDETPNYTTAFEEVICKFKKKHYSSIAKELLQSILNNSWIDSDDLSKEDIECLILSQEIPNDLDSSSRFSGSSNLDNSVRITRMFRDLRELAQWIPTTNVSPSDISLSRRLLELQRELEEFLDN